MRDVCEKQSNELQMQALESEIGETIKRKSPRENVIQPAVNSSSSHLSEQSRRVVGCDQVLIIEESTFLIFSRMSSILHTPLVCCDNRSKKL
jgi:hypothetical protein